MGSRVVLRYELLVLQLPTIGNHDFGSRGTGLTPHTFNRFHNIHSFRNGSKHDVFPIEPGGGIGTQEKLRSVRVGPGVGHAENTRPRVFERKVFVLKLVAVNGFTARACIGNG